MRKKIINSTVALLPLITFFLIETTQSKVLQTTFKSWTSMILLLPTARFQIILPYKIECMSSENLPIKITSKTLEKEVTSAKNEEITKIILE